ncbi:XTP/dITP diphosphatase [candidate division KSB1 bacterium]|nr:XTP/dITP diphosphatase [candidate division KSB1 bacterium]
MFNTFVLATLNHNKVKEVQDVFCQEKWKLVSLHEFIEAKPPKEDGETFTENALIKARAAYGLTKLPCLADDSGLEVDALEGHPGIYSSRFAGEHATDQENNQKLLKMLTSKSDKERTARFKCAVALVADEVEYTVEGACEGYIINQPRGDDGFGYDPLFLVPNLGKTFAEIPLKQKNQISHRSIAFKRMAQLIHQLDLKEI